MLWWILFEPEVHFGEHVVVPDLGAWRRERMQDVPFFSLAPNWICEVLSPSTERIDRGRKLRIYAEAGVAQAWLVNPTGAHPGGAPTSGRGVDDRRGVQRSDTIRIEPFEAIELALERLWIDSPGSPDPLQSAQR